MAYIIDTYNRHNKWDREHAVYTFIHNKMPFAIKKVELKNGIPILPEPIDNREYTNPSSYFIYNTEIEARNFVTLIKSLNS